MAMLNDEGNVTWFSSKDTLLEIFYQKYPKTHPPILLSKDKELDQNKKVFTAFGNQESFLEFITKYKYDVAHGKCEEPFMHEIIPTNTQDPCFLYFDIDRDLDPIKDAHIINNYALHMDNVISAFLKVLTNFLKEAYDIHVDLIIGKNVQISVPRSYFKELFPNDICHKLSAHVKLDILLPNSLCIKNMIMPLKSYILSNIHTDTETRNLLTYNHVRRQSNNPHCQCIIDDSVYSNFRSFRMLYSAKRKSTSVQSLPYPGCSQQVVDHLVVHHSKSPYSNTQPLVLKSGLPEVNFKAKINLDLIRSANVNQLPLSISHEDAKNIKQIHGISRISSDHLDIVFNGIVNSPVICNFLRTTPYDLRDNLYFDDKQYRPNVVTIHMRQKRYCPCAKRVHKSNRSYFVYNFQMRRLFYYCFDEECVDMIQCKKFHNVFDLQLEMDYIAPAISISNVDSLHCKDQVISWNEEYNEPQMRPYPHVPFCCIRANMGVGKTKMIADHFLPQVDQETQGNYSCLFITYQRLLSSKYHNDLYNLGFKNYMDIKNHVIHDDKVIVCLDSIGRVAHKTFDYVIIDEATSVFMHFSSEHMKQTSNICVYTDALIHKAKYVYMLDACIDNTIVHEVVSHICQTKNITPYYIKNTYVRPTNRACDIFVDYKDSDKMKTTDIKSCFKISAIKKVERLVHNKKKVVVVSSTKSFAEQVHIHLQNTFGDNINMTIFTSDTEKIGSHNLDCFEYTCMATDVLIYSPTITAGVSFELPQFDQLVAFVDNAFYAPSVDTVLQQLFRIRELNDGKMSIYLNEWSKVDSFSLDKKDIQKYPITLEDVEKNLDGDLHIVENAYENRLKNFDKPHTLNVVNSAIEYDKQSLSYKILTGMIINFNKSKHLFGRLLMKTLTEDYNIPTRIINRKFKKSYFDQAMLMQTEINKHTAKTDIPWDPKLVIRESAYDKILEKERNHEDITPFEKTQKWIFDMNKKCWKVPPSNIDQGFYDGFIMAPTKPNIDKAFKTFFKYKRTLEFLSRDNNDIAVRIKSQLENIHSKKENSFQLYNKIKQKHLNKIMYGVDFLEKGLFRSMPDYKEQLKKGDVKIHTDQFRENIRDYINDMSNDEFMQLCETCVESQNCHKIRYKKDLNIDNAFSVFIFTRNVLYNSFAYDIEKAPSKNKRKGNQCLTIKNVFKHVQEKYNAESLFDIQDSCMISNDEFGMIHDQEVDMF